MMEINLRYWTLGCSEALGARKLAYIGQEVLRIGVNLGKVMAPNMDLEMFHNLASRTFSS